MSAVTNAAFSTELISRKRLINNASTSGGVSGKRRLLTGIELAGAVGVGIVEQRNPAVDDLIAQHIGHAEGEWAFAHPAVSGSEVQARLETRFNAAMVKRLDATELHFQIDSNGLLTLTGEVRSEDAKEMAEMVARMEPGVRDVRNELSVASTSAAQ